MEQQNTPAPSLSGSLLLASPALRDPNFFHTVLFLAAHTTGDGAFGYILNRPLEKNVSDLLDDPKLGPLADLPVFLGGPVGTDKLSFASIEWSPRKHELRCHSHLSTEQAIREVEKGRHVRGFVGYSGWSEGQLENELEHNSWITCPAQKKILTAPDPAELWRVILDGLGPYYQLLARMPGDVSLN